MDFSFDDMLQPGSKFGEDDKTCHITVYDHGLMSNPQRKFFYVGARYFSKYYIVFDQSKVEKQSFIQIGFALKNEDNLAGK